MSFRPPYSLSRVAFPPPPNYASVPSNRNPVCSTNQDITPIRNIFVSGVYGINRSGQGIISSNNSFRNDFISPQQTNNPPLCNDNPVNFNVNRMPISAPVPARFPISAHQYYPPRSINLQTEQPPFINNNDQNSTIQMNSYQKGFPYTVQNVNNNNLPAVIHTGSHLNNPSQFSNLVSKTSLPHNVVSTNMQTNNIMTFTQQNVVPVTDNMKNSVLFPGNSQNFPIAPPPLLPNSTSLVPLQMQNNYPAFDVPPPVLPNISIITSDSNNSPETRKETELCEFLKKFSCIQEKKESQITVPEYRSVLKAAFSLIKLLIESKCKLKNLIEADENEWNSEMLVISKLQHQLSDICSLVTEPIHLNAIVKKLKIIKKKREVKKKTKLNKLSQKIKAEQNRRELNQAIDKYLDDIKEKNLKLKRETEMKKEADYILLEVRKKIHEAKRTIEKLKVFEKLRNARQANAVQKGLHILPVHNENFEKKVTCLKETMVKQLADYEAEENALKVMLETEQEGQLEEENQWKLKKARTLLQIKKNHIKESLFGNAEDPESTDPLFLFHKFHTSANDSIENLVQIRHSWDVHLNENGEAVPQQWIVPVTPSNPSWESCLLTSIASKN